MLRSRSHISVLFHLESVIGIAAVVQSDQSCAECDINQVY